jgi:hypothetical protein
MHFRISTPAPRQFNLKINIFHRHGLEQHTTLGSKYVINLQQNKIKLILASMKDLHENNAMFCFYIINPN